jgi:formylglycine-generating enzyme required for sulfatase activity
MEPNQVVPPSTEELQAYSLGKSQPSRVEEIEAYLTGGPDCGSILEAAPEDALVRHLRGAGELPRVEGSSPGAATVTGSESELGADAAPLLDHPRYRLIRKLGQGGMGKVYLAEHRLMRRLVAIKLIRAGYLGNPQLIQRFRQEVEAAARLSHPHIVAAHDADEADGTHFLVMEYVEGESLAERLARQGPLPVHEACTFVRQAALGLQFAHEKGMVHRDIKPANLMRAVDGTVKILDFGLARVLREAALPEGPLTTEGAIMGTADYMAPEQAQDCRHADIRADVYSLGCTLYHLLSGRVPFPGGTAIDKILQHASARPEPLLRRRAEVPVALAQVVDRMMARNPEERYQTPGEVAAALEPFVGAEAVQPPRRLRRRFVAVAATLAAAILVAGIVFFRNGLPGIVPRGDNDSKGSPDGLVDAAPESPLVREIVINMGMKFVLVPKGKFWMGGGGGQPGEKEVEIPYDFYLGAYEVTQEEWQKVMETNPSRFSRTGLDQEAVKEIANADLKRFPVESVSWNDAQLFVSRLNNRDKRQGWVYRLPTEKEWEYACRGGPMTDPSQSAYHFYFKEPTNQLLPELANYKRPKGLARPCKVGSYQPNALGLYDMHGNVTEWCEDVYQDSMRVHRGGSWWFNDNRLRAALSNADAAAHGWADNGLRLAIVRAGTKRK